MTKTTTRSWQAGKRVAIYDLTNCNFLALQVYGADRTDLPAAVFTRGVIDFVQTPGVGGVQRGIVRYEYPRGDPCAACPGEVHISPSISAYRPKQTLEARRRKVADVRFAGVCLNGASGQVWSFSAPYNCADVRLISLGTHKIDIGEVLHGGRTSVSSDRHDSPITGMSASIPMCARCKFQPKVVGG